MVQRWTSTANTNGARTNLTPLYRLLTRSKDEIVDKFLAYNRVGGKILSGLTRRRQEERVLFITSVHKEGWGKEDDRWRFYDNSGEYI